MKKRRGAGTESGQALHETEQGRTVHIKILSRFDNVEDFFGRFKKRKVPSIFQLDIILRTQQTSSLTSLFKRWPIILSIDKCDWQLKFRILFFLSLSRIWTCDLQVMNLMRSKIEKAHLSDQFSFTQSFKMTKNGTSMPLHSNYKLSLD